MLSNKQSGMSSLGMLTILLLAGFFLLAAFRVGPLYFDNIYVAEGLRSLSNPDGDLSTLNKSQVKAQLGKYFLLNNIRDFSMDSIQVKKDDSGLLVTADYEKRVHLIHNIDVVLVFQNHWHSSNPDECCSPQSE